MSMLLRLHYSLSAIPPSSCFAFLSFSVYYQLSAFVAFALGWYDSKDCIDIASEVEATKCIKITVKNHLN